jgi:hypothetical protein
MVNTRELPVNIVTQIQAKDTDKPVPQKGIVAGLGAF